jgi:hypothetical protein
MDIDKANRVRTYVQAQLAFVPFYGTDLLAPGGSTSGAFGLRTPLLTARNPLVTIQSDFNPSLTFDCIESQGSKCALAEAVPSLAKKAAEDRKRRLAKRSTVTKEQKKQSLTLKRGNSTTSGRGDPTEPAENVSPVKRKKGRHREKSRFPTGLSFLYNFAPENVGPSRLTVGRSNTVRNPKFIALRCLPVIRGFLRKESHLRLYMVSLPWARLVGSIPSSAVAVIYTPINSAVCFPLGPRTRYDKLTTAFDPTTRIS